MGSGNLDLWRLSERLSVVDAAILATGNDPSEKDHDENGYPYKKTSHEGFEAVFSALRRAVIENKIKANLAYRAVNTNYINVDLYSGAKISGENYRHLILFLNKDSKVHKLSGSDVPENSDVYVLAQEPDWGETTIDFTVLQSWFSSRGQFPRFFFPDGDSKDPRNRKNPRYSAKLACALAAWEAIDGPAPRMSVKETLAAWAKDNAKKFTVQENSAFSENAISDIARVANWNTSGGANKTGGAAQGAGASSVKQPDNHEEWKGLSAGAWKSGRNLIKGEVSLDDDTPF